MPWRKEDMGRCECPCEKEVSGDDPRVRDWEKNKSQPCFCDPPCGECYYWWDEGQSWDVKDNSNMEEKEGSLEKSRWQKAKMEWYVLGKNVICAKCHKGLPDKVKSRALKLEKVNDGVVCAKCGAAPLSVRKGAVVLLEAGEKVYCPTCAKERESVLLQKAVMVASLEDDDIVPTPLWCDRCGEPLSVTISEEAATVLHKTIEGLETIIFNKNLRDIRPSLWRRALEWKEKLEDYLLKANVYKKSGEAAS
jgi:DNA-directed RNA polymerase subunit RPC12/RpoP